MITIIIVTSGIIVPSGYSEITNAGTIVKVDSFVTHPRAHFVTELSSIFLNQIPLKIWFVHIVERSSRFRVWILSYLANR